VSARDVTREAVAALGGRCGWRWWLPLALYLAVAAFTRLSFEPPASGSWWPNTAAAAVYLTATQLQVLMLWRAAAEHVRAGGARVPAFAVASVSMVVFPQVMVALSTVAANLELAWVGTQGPRVFPLAADHGVAGTTMQAGIIAALAVVALTWGTACVSLVVLLAAAWRWVGFLVGLVIGSTLFVALLALVTSLPLPLPARLTFAVLSVVMLVPLWFVFARIPAGAGVPTSSQPKTPSHLPSPQHPGQ
jgi:hypothetical protein